MGKFSVKKIDQIRGKIEFYKLYIDGKCEYDDFQKDVEGDGQYKSELHKLQAIIQLVSECKPMPEKKHRDITPKKEHVKEYEIKTKNLRVYTFHDKERGRIIVCGGKKRPTVQKNDISHFRQLKKTYFNSEINVLE